MWMQLVFAVGMAYLSYTLQPDPPKDEAPERKIGNVPHADVGRKIPVLFGTRDFESSNCVWYGDVTVEPIEGESGKK